MAIEFHKAISDEVSRPVQIDDIDGAGLIRLVFGSSSSEKAKPMRADTEGEEERQNSRVVQLG